MSLGFYARLILDLNWLGFRDLFFVLYSLASVNWLTRFFRLAASAESC